MKSFEREYLCLLNKILSDGEDVEVRNGTAKQLFGANMKIDLRDGFPLLTSKKMNFKLALEEFIWDIEGGQNVNELGPVTRKFWDTWSNEDGNLAASYGRSWRRFPQANLRTLKLHEIGTHSQYDIDQLKLVEETLKENPTSRRMVVSTWCPSSAWNEPIPPCHPNLVFSSNGRSLDLLVTARSNDMCLGFPWDVARYALMVHMFANEADLEPRDLAFSWANAHIYSEHFELAEEQIERAPFMHNSPKLEVVGSTSLEDVTAESFELSGYQPLPFMPYEFIK